MMKPRILFQLGHDAAITVFDVQRNKFIHLELERIAQIKHVNLVSGNVDQKRPLFINTIKRALQLIQRDHGISPDFEYVYVDIGVSITLAWKEEIHSIIKNLVTYKHFVEETLLHHDAHAYCGYIQAPMEEAVVLSWDGVGANEFTVVHEIKQGKHTFRKSYRHAFGQMYNVIARQLDSLKKTHANIDLGGKLMGLSPYGFPSETFEEDLKYVYDGSIAEERFTSRAYAVMTDSMCRFVPNLIIDIARPYRIDELYGPQFNETKDRWRKHQVTGDKELELAYLAQAMIDKALFEIVEEHLDRIKSCGNNLIIVGGVSLNILANSKLRDAYPDMNIYIPNNGNDSGLGVGYMAKHLLDAGIISYKNPYDLRHSGVNLEDSPKRKGTPISVQGVANLLKDGKIIGFLQGKGEIGPRALGYRSILCCAKPGMKDKLNEKVKGREWFRPFAPVCAVDDAHKYFTAPHFRNMDNMTFLAYIKPEYLEELESCDHKGKSRLQTVSKYDNPVLYDILKAYDGVLLNTSFNRGGKPILNTFRDAFYILDTTELDYVVFANKKGQLFLFEEEKND